LTEDGNVEITGRDLREREVRAHYARPSAMAGPLHESRETSRSRRRTPVPRADQDRGPA
jgi:hypothetical protein